MVEMLFTKGFSSSSFEKAVASNSTRQQQSDRRSMIDAAAKTFRTTLNAEMKKIAKKKSA